MGLKPASNGLSATVTRESGTPLLPRARPRRPPHPTGDHGSKPASTVDRDWRDRMRQRIAECASLDEAKEILEAARAAAGREGAELRVRCERVIGGILRRMNPRDRWKVPWITRPQAHFWQRLAALPAATFEREVTAPDARPSTCGVLNFETRTRRTLKPPLPRRPIERRSRRAATGNQIESSDIASRPAYTGSPKAWGREPHCFQSEVSHRCNDCDAPRSFHLGTDGRWYCPSCCPDCRPREVEQPVDVPAPTRGHTAATTCDLEQREALRARWRDRARLRRARQKAHDGIQTGGKESAFRVATRVATGFKIGPYSENYEKFSARKLLI